jgi:hypothetical protein
VLTSGFDVIRDLDVVVTLATRQDPVRFAACRCARHIEGQGRTHSPAEPVVKREKPTPVQAPDVALQKAS